MKKVLLIIFSLAATQASKQQELKRKEIEARQAQQEWGKEIVALKIDQNAKQLNEETVMARRAYLKEKSLVAKK